MHIEIDHLEIKTNIKDNTHGQLTQITLKNSAELELLIEKYLDKKLRKIITN